MVVLYDLGGGKLFPSRRDVVENAFQRSVERDATHQQYQQHHVREQSRHVRHLGYSSLVASRFSVLNDQDHFRDHLNCCILNEVGTGVCLF